VCCAYLMERRRMRFLEALDVIRRRRPQAQPNLGFTVGRDTLTFYVVIGVCVVLVCVHSELADQDGFTVYRQISVAKDK
jgi:hypothetical protein